MLGDFNVNSSGEFVRRNNSDKSKLLSEDAFFSDSSSFDQCDHGSAGSSIDSLNLPDADSIIQSTRKLPASRTRAEELCDRWIVDRSGQQYRYLIGTPYESVLMVFVAGLSTGLISFGIGEVCTAVLNARCRVPFRIAAASSTMITLITILSANATTILLHDEEFEWRLILFSAPGAFLGGVVGVLLSNRIQVRRIEVLLIGVYMLIATAVCLCAWSAYAKCRLGPCDYF